MFRYLSCVRLSVVNIVCLVQGPPSESDEECRLRLLRAMDNFVNEKFIFADQMIMRHAFDKIDDGDVIMTYGLSSVVLNILLHAKKVLSCV
jgi:translation initiation factor 2B subunit (eIF-2B alpha/beta/delta family)